MEFSGIALPEITEQGLGSAQERRQILEALYALNQQLRYMMDNIGVENLDAELGAFVTETGEQARQLTREMADAQGNMAVIRQTAKKIELSVEDADGKIAELEITANRISAIISGESRVYSQDTAPVPSPETPVEDGDLWVDTSTGDNAVYRFENGSWALTDGESLDERMARAESSIVQNTDRIALTVRKNGVISSINQTAETISIEAKRINFNGAISANGNFMILEDGTVKAVNGHFGGDMQAGNWLFNQNGMRYTSGGNFVAMMISGNVAYYQTQGYAAVYGSNDYQEVTVMGEKVTLRCQATGQSVSAMYGGYGGYPYTDVCLICDQAGASYDTARGNLGTTDFRWDVFWCDTVHYNTRDTSSSRALKHDIEPMEDMGAVIDALEPVTFKYNDGDGRTRNGLIYEDVIGVYPEICRQSKEGGKTHLGIVYDELIPVLLKEVKAMRAREAEREERMAALEARVMEIEERVGA